MSATVPNNALVVATSIGFTTIFTVVDALAKHLGMNDPVITSERGRGRVVALWRCPEAIALEAQSCFARIQREIAHPLELEVFLNATALERRTFSS